MDLYPGKHPADQKASEFISMMLNHSRRIINYDENNTRPISSKASSRRSSINFDICYELDNRKTQTRSSNQDAPIQNTEKCPHCKAPLLDKLPIHSTSVDITLLGCEKEITFIRAITWMKSSIKMMKDVSANDIHELFRGLSEFGHRNNLFISSSSCIRDIDVMMQNPRIMGMPQLQGSCIRKRQYLIPEDEDPVSQMSNPMSFGEAHDNEHTTRNAWPIDSGIALLDSIDISSKTGNSRLEYYKEDNSTISSNVEIFFKHPENRDTRKRSESSVETISWVSLSNLIENLRVDNFVLGEIRIILSFLERVETPTNYVKNGALIRDAISTIVQFLNQLVTEDDMSSSAVYLKLCTENIMSTIGRILNSNTYTKLNAAARQFQLITVVDFCNCRKICEKTIDLLIKSLTELTENIDVDFDESEDQLTINDNSESQLLCRILQMTVYKYREIVRPLREIKENSHHYTTFIWRELWKNHKQYESPEFRARELEIEWIRRLAKFIDPERPIPISMFGDYKEIVTITRMLSALPLGQI